MTERIRWAAAALVVMVVVISASFAIVGQVQRNPEPQPTQSAGRGASWAFDSASRKLVGSSSVGNDGGGLAINDADHPVLVAPLSCGSSCYTVTFWIVPAGCGAITFGGYGTFGNGAGEGNVPPGTYAVSATSFCDSILHSLVGSGQVSVSAGVATVSGNGAITATFGPQLYEVSFTTKPANCGSITFNGTTYTYGSGTAVPAGTYPVSATTCAGYSLQSLTGIGGVSVGGDEATVNGVGGIIATFSVTTYPVTFTESGLPSGTEWWVNVAGQVPLRSTTSTDVASLPNGTYTYTVTSANKDYVAAGGGVSVNGAPVPVTVTFSLVTYWVTVSESGLPAGATWYFNVTGEPSLSGTINETNGSSRLLGEFLPNGTYASRVATADKEYSPNGSFTGASFVVNGTGLVETVKFSLVTYPVIFEETGLPTKTLAKDGWTVVLNGIRVWNTISEIFFSGMPNATYGVLITGPSGYTVSGEVNWTGNGTLRVAGPTLVRVSMAPFKTAKLTFAEKGLRKGTKWCVGLDGAPECSTAAATKFLNLTPGVSYGYAVVSPIVGQTITPGATGTVLVTKSTSVSLTFTYPYAVVFTQTGLTSGSWSVTIKGHTETVSAVNGSILFDLKNGTYGFKVGAISGYTTVSSPKKAVVNGAGITITVTFAVKAKKAMPAGLLELPLALAAVPAGLRKRRLPH